MKKIQKVLIANRGEPVRRTIRTLKRLDLEAVTLATVEDRSSDWVTESHHCLPVSSYLQGDEIVSKAKQIGVDAIWPGWGFLSENAEFAEAVSNAGIVWIGPRADIIEQLGSKEKATELAKKAGLLTIPEASIAVDNVSSDISLQMAKKACEEIGFPILLKPALGGGGQGQAVLYSLDELPEIWEQVLNINQTQFKSGPILVQKFFENARHIEAQVLADNFGNAVILGERECSIQRRNQKVIEEAPSPALSPEIRKKFIEDSSRFVQAIEYNNAGTIEYLFSDGKFYFLEMNTRLQVEHPVTEETIRIGKKKIDLLEWMIRLAQGEKLDFTQADVVQKGWAFESRIYAEDVAKNFRPAPGKITYHKFPFTQYIRVETAFTNQPSFVSENYDPMIAKIISWGEDRKQAMERLKRSLKQTVILGVPTNINLNQQILEENDFLKGDFSTRYLSEHPQVKEMPFEDFGFLFSVAATLRAHFDRLELRESLRSQDPTSVHHVMDRIPVKPFEYAVTYQNQTLNILVFEEFSQGYRVVLSDPENDFHYDLELVAKSANTFTVILPNHAVKSVYCVRDKDQFQIHALGQAFDVQVSSLENLCDLDPHAAPMTGKIVKICVKPHQDVKKGDELYQIESMKMITSVRATHDGQIQEVFKAENDAVQPGDAVVKVFGQAENISEDYETQSELKLESLARTLEPLDCVVSFFKGYDVSLGRLQDALASLKKQLDHKEFQNDFTKTLIQVFNINVTVSQLFQHNEHVMTYLAEQEDVAVQTLPKASVEIVKSLLEHYGHSRLSELSSREQILLRMFQSHKSQPKEKVRLLCELLQIAKDFKIFPKDLVEPMKAWLKFKPEMSETQRQNLLEYLYELEPKLYYSMGGMPVALDLFSEYQKLQNDPMHGLDKKQCQALLEEIDSSEPQYQKLTFQDFPKHLRDHLQNWFQYFEGRALKLPDSLHSKKIFLYELVSADAAERDNIPPRFIVLALVAGEFPEHNDGILILSEYEKAAILSYQALRIVQKGREHSPNNVFLLSEDLRPIPWRTRDGHQDSKAVNPKVLKMGASRVSGFASGIHIQATEVVLPLRNEETNATELSVLEIRHAKDKYILSRPPYPIALREAKKPQDRFTQMNEKQHRMGKLLNPDRATLLFDDGEFEELKFPKIDDEPGIGLNVYRGKVNGKDTLAYAGDFRFRGGALGEREGKKLAATVVLAYISGCTLVAFHDGAGANIKESVASLGWAGAYFGAIAHTGGFSTKKKFIEWYENHICKKDFDEILEHFGVLNNWQSQVQKNTDPFLHFHLHVGATVGMLVYGAAIAHLSLMVDQPEAYRVLTGAGTVKKVLGENGTNYSLGGAKAHARESGDIEIVCQSEEEVIDQTRRLTKLFLNSKRQDKILRHPDFPPLKVPKRAGVILGRTGLRAHVDQGEFFEIRQELKNAASILTGYASLAGYPLALAVTATDYGISHSKGFQKVMTLMEAAQDVKAPVVVVCGAQWEAPSLPVSQNWLMARQEFYQNLKRITVPKISLALGPRAIEQTLHDHMDITVYVMRGNETEEELERIHQLCPFVFEDLTQAFDGLPKLIEILQVEQTATSFENKATQISLPQELTTPYNMYEAIDSVFDTHSFLEFYKGDNLPLITGLARLGGRTVGVIADNPMVESGAQNAKAILKFTRLNRFCEAWNLPIVELSDSPAFRPGSEQEHSGIQGIGGRSIREECLSRNPKRVVTLRQNYGGRFIHANLITLGLPRQGFALKDSKIGVMGAKGAVGVLFGKKLMALDEAQRADQEQKRLYEYETNQLDPQQAVKLGYVEKLIDVPDIRKVLWESLHNL